jgi:hypothetical protein
MIAKVEAIDARQKELLAAPCPHCDQSGFRSLGSSPDGRRWIACTVCGEQVTV